MSITQPFDYHIVLTYTYITKDNSGPTFDPAQIRMGTTTLYTSTNSLATTQTGPLEFDLPAGTALQFTITSTDSLGGAATMTITQFTATLPSPTSQPSTQPTGQPSTQPSRRPASQPSSRPTRQPSMQPTSKPSDRPSSQPTSSPTTQSPTGQPSSQPSRHPTGQPSSRPTRQPSSQPTRRPTGQPSQQPSRQPTSAPSRMAKKRKYRLFSHP